MSITEGPVFVVTPSGFLLFVACDTPWLSLEDSMAGSQGAVGLRWSCQPSSVLWVLRVPEHPEDAGLCLLCGGSRNPSLYKLLLVSWRAALLCTDKE